MKLIFNDATEIIVQQVESHGDYLRILTVGITPEQLKVLFTDSSRTSRMIVQERGQTIATYKGYTAYDHAEIYTGQIYGVVLYKEGTTTEERLTNVEDTVNQTNTDLQMAIAELTTVIATLATSAAGTPQNIEINDAEKMYICMLNPMQTRTPAIGLLSGIGSTPFFAPIALKTLISKEPLEENDRLLNTIKLDKDDYHLLKYYNMMVVNRPAALFLE